MNRGYRQKNPPPPPMVVIISVIVNVVYLVPGVYVPSSYMPYERVPLELPPKYRSYEPGASSGEENNID